MEIVKKYQWLSGIGGGRRINRWSTEGGREGVGKVGGRCEVYDE